MVYRKGELSKAAMDQDWPHQVALPAYRCLGHNYLTMRFFCEGEGLSLCPRTPSLRRTDQDVLVFSFAERTHAEHFLLASAAFAVGHRMASDGVEFVYTGL
jgi:hypothetical protein